MSKESHDERLDRELIELLNELRVALPGVQVLFAFLLTVPFSDRFAEITETERAVFTISFLATAVSSVLLIGPTAYHRLRFRRYDKEQILVTANRLAITGLAFLAVAIASAVWVVVDLVYGAWIGSLTASAVSGLLAWLWFGLPLLRTLRERE